MAGMGAVAPNLREGNQSTFVLNLPLIFTILSINQLIETPFSSFTTFMTLFPFTSPVVMLTRLSVGPVPAWQLIASIALLVGTVIIVIRGVANLFSSPIPAQRAKDERRAILEDGFHRSPPGLTQSDENSRPIGLLFFGSILTNTSH